MENKKVIIYTDGGARGNPGPAGIGVVIEGYHTHGEYIGETTNNVAEYSALVYAVKKAKELFADSLSSTELEIRMDSELIVKQMKGEYAVKNEGLKPLFLEVQKLRPQFAGVNFLHIPRAKNAEADALVNKALDEAL